MKNFLSKNWRRILIIIAACFIIYNMYNKLSSHTNVLDAYKNNDRNNEENINNQNENKPIENNNPNENTNTKPEETNTNTNSNENNTNIPGETNSDNTSHDQLPPKN
jgi:hypothetical protein